MHYLDEWRKTIESIGGLSEAQRRLEEMSSALTSVEGRMNLYKKIKQDNPIEK